jgi:hypothetical protein
VGFQFACGGIVLIVDLVRREYVEALENEMQEKRQLETLETMIAEAKAVVRRVVASGAHD